MTSRRFVLLSCALLLSASCSSDDDNASPPASTTTITSAAPTSAPDTTAAANTTVIDIAPPTSTTTAPPGDPLAVGTTSGGVRGTASGVAGVRAFLAMPYAAPPVGENRWRPPQPAPQWEQPFEATVPGAACPQPTEGVTAAVTVIPEWSEDCLTLSVWSLETAQDLPVMVWFHGGGLDSGSAHQPFYIGDRLAARGVVVVNVNYRLGALGFLATDELAAEGDGAFGNYGLADQVAALRWVQDNVANFGGNPGNVTIFGESAGGFSVCGHLAAPGSAGLFHRAIVQSGGGCNRAQPGDEAKAAGAAFLRATGCGDIACLRRLSPDQLIAAPFSSSLVADGTTLAATAYDEAVAGTPPAVPVLIGSNADEATLFTIGAPEPSEDELLARAATTGADPASVLALYPAEQYPTNLARDQALFTDSFFVCPTLAFAAAAPDTFVYHYAYVSPTNPFGLGATHGVELALLFAHPEGVRGLPTEFDPATAALSATIQQAWVAFAYSGNPGWAPFGADGHINVLDDPVVTTTEIRDGRCAALAEIMP